ncbi:MAG: spermidine synthase, partial [Deltaproteobacteria bacterium]
MLSLLLLGSGTAALAYEVLWARDWALVYGSTAVGTAVVLAAYFAGLALGAGLAARLGPRRRGLGLYAALEAGVAAAALLYLGVRPLLPGAAVWLARTAPPPLLPAARALLAFAVLVVPAALLGATLPAATATLQPGDASGAGRLYAWNTCGGALGALVCGV